MMSWATCLTAILVYLKIQLFAAVSIVVTAQAICIYQRKKEINMGTEVASEIWGELKRYVNVVDRMDAAESIVAILIDHDHDVDEIKDAFKGDSDIKKALTAYLDNDKDYAEEEEEEEFDDEDNYNQEDDY
jgi:hypothetical protein